MTMSLFCKLYCLVSARYCFLLAPENNNSFNIGLYNIKVMSYVLESEEKQEMPHSSQMWRL